MPFFERLRARLSGQAEVESVDVGEEFQKVQRSLRRLSLAADRSSEILQVVSGRLDELQQAFLERSPSARQAALLLEEAQLLDVLDRLDRAAQAPNLPEVARSALEGATSQLLAAARWQPIARIGSKPQGADIRIAEFLGEADANGHAGAVIHRVLEQGYRRADGTLLRPGVVIAAVPGSAERAEAPGNRAQAESIEHGQRPAPPISEGGQT